jgi:hypothetical protein
MIVADKRVLETSLNQGMVQIQNSLVQQYTFNLNAIAFVSVICGNLLLNMLQQGSWPSIDGPDVVNRWFCYGLSAVGMTVSFYIFSMATIYAIWGPMMAMHGEDASSVIEATRMMRKNQYEMFLLINVIYVVMFMTTIMWTWSLTSTGVAAICMFIYVAGTIVIVYMAYKTVMAFDPKLTLKSMLNPASVAERVAQEEDAEREKAISEVKVSRAAKRNGRGAYILQVYII